MTMIPRWWRRGFALALAVWMLPLPLAAQGAHPGAPADVAADHGVAARAVAPARPMPVTEAIPLAARRHRAGLTQAPAPPRRKSAARCAGRIALFGALGAATGLAAAGALLAVTGGSDDTSGILTRYGVAGAAGGAVVGAILCAV